MNAGRAAATLRVALILSSAAALGILLGREPLGAAARQAQNPGVRLQPVVYRALKHDVSPRLDSLPMLPPERGELDAVRLNKMLPGRLRALNQPVDETWRDSAVQLFPGPGAMPATAANFDGVNNVSGVLPPDTQGDVGPDHYVQWVNLAFAVYDKSGTKLYGPASGNTLWQGFGGPCETTNDGDPITLYDAQAGRWFMSQFSVEGPYYQCVAVSLTGDPLGQWYRYQWDVPVNKMNDYPHFGVWPDGYYMSVNQFTNGTTWGGQGVVAFERTKLLAGQLPQAVYFDLYSTNPALGGMLPSDLDGDTPPPAGSPNYFMEADDAWSGGQDYLQVFKFHVDWTTPANSTFTQSALVNLSALGYGFDSNLCNYSRNCIPQPGTPRGLDAISDRLMYRLAYRNFGDHESIVVNHTVDVGTNHAGIRWYEIRNPGAASPSIFQAGTYAPDTDHRWMGSIAMDKDGDIALGFSVASGSTYPSIRYVGRLAGDPLGQLSQAEATLMAGSGSQTHTAARWGDYSMLTIDPVDDCTFWYTTEYLASTGSAPWRTRIGSFKFPGCTPAPPTVTSLPANRTSPFVIDGTTSITWTANTTGGVAPLQYQFWRYDVGTSSYTLTQDYGASVTYSWTPAAGNAGTYFIRVYVRNAATASGYDAVGYSTYFTLLAAGPPTVSSVLPDRPSPMLSNGTNTVTWTVTATGGVAPLQYQFWRRDNGTGTYTLGQDYSPSASYAWTPAAGTNASVLVRVYVRNAGTASGYDAAGYSPSFTVTSVAPLAVTSVLPNASSPMVGNGVNTVTWTASTTGGTAPLLYQFWRYNVGTSSYTLAQDFGAAATFAWTPTAGDQGTYAIRVYVRNAGTATGYDAVGYAPYFTITAAAPPTVTSVLPDRPSPMVGNGTNTVTWTANTSGGTAPLQYQFWLRNNGTGVYTLLQDWGTNATAPWTPSVGSAGTYLVRVYVRNAATTSGSDAVGYSAWFLIQ